MKTCRRTAFPRGAVLDCLESRLLLSAALAHNRLRSQIRLPHRKPAHAAEATVMVDAAVTPNAISPPGNAFTPATMRHAYGFDQIQFGSIAGDGTGQTIAIIDAYDDPNAFSDLQQFDLQFGLPDPPSFQRVTQTGATTGYPSLAPAGSNWDLEIALDVEWAHAIAPGASLLLVEAKDSGFTNLIQGAAAWAAAQPGVAVVSMSFGGAEYSTETALDSIFTTPSGHNGVTFVASTGDTAAPAGYPAYSPNVVAVGGTSLSLNADGSYLGESAWGSSGGGISAYEPEPNYQRGIVPISLTTTKRATPDVSMDANPGTGVAVYDSIDYPGSPWIELGGTSLAAPMFAGLIAIANQGRATLSLPALDGASQTLPMLYSMPASSFHDIVSGMTTGSPNYSATAGYDLTTGRGSPIANRVVYGLMGTGSISGTVFQDNNSDGVLGSGDVAQAGVTVYIDTNNTGTLETGTTTSASNTTAVSIPTRNSTGVASAVSISGGGMVSNLALSFTLSYATSTNVNVQLIAPDGTAVVVFSGASGTGSSTISLSDQALRPINAATAPYSGSYTPAFPLADLNGEAAAGSWSLKVINANSRNAGSLISWSLAVTTGLADVYRTTTDAAGHYTFGNLPLGTTYTVREVAPTGYAQSAPLRALPAATAPLASAATVNLTNFPTVFTASGATSYYLTLDPTRTYLQISTGTTAGSPVAYQVVAANLPALTFNLTGAANVLVLDFSNGSPIPLGNITLNTTAGTNEELRVFGQSPTEAFTLVNTGFALVGGGAVSFQSLPTLTLYTCTVTATGDLSTLQTLNVFQGATLNW